MLDVKMEREASRHKSEATDTPITECSPLLRKFFLL
jgi:hypothetical protein